MLKLNTNLNRMEADTGTDDGSVGNEDMLQIKQAMGETLLKQESGGEKWKALTQERSPLSTPRSYDSDENSSELNSTLLTEDDRKKMEIRKFMDSWLSQRDNIEKRMVDFKQKQVLLEFETSVHVVGTDEEKQTGTPSLQNLVEHTHINSCSLKPNETALVPSPKPSEPDEIFDECTLTMSTKDETTQQRTRTRVSYTPENDEDEGISIMSESKSDVDFEQRHQREGNSSDPSHILLRNEINPEDIPKFSKDEAKDSELDDENNDPEVPKSRSRSKERKEIKNLKVNTRLTYADHQIQPNAETIYNSPRSRSRKNELLRWKQQKHESRHTPLSQLTSESNNLSRTPTIMKSRRIRQRALRVERPQMTKGFEGQTVGTRETIKADKWSSDIPLGERRSRSVTPRKYQNIKSKLYSPTAASLARESSIAREKFRSSSVSREYLLDRSRPSSNNIRKSLTPNRRTIPSPRRTRPLNSSKLVSKRPLSNKRSQKSPSKIVNPAQQSSLPPTKPPQSTSLVTLPTKKSSISKAHKPLYIEDKEEERKCQNSCTVTSSQEDKLSTGSGESLSEISERRVLFSLISSDDSEGDVPLNSYHADDKSCNHAILSNVDREDKKSQNESQTHFLPQNQSSSETHLCDMKESRRKTQNFSVQQNLLKHVSNDNIQIPQNIGKIIDRANCCKVEKLWLNFALSNNFICVQKCDSTEKKLNSEEFNVEQQDDYLKCDSQLSNGMKQEVKDKSKAPLYKNFLKEWPKDATKKNQKAKQMIDEASEKNDLESMVKLCHKFREEFMIARFYIGVLMMEKEELERKLVTMSDTLKEHIDELNITITENMHLKEQILELHYQLDSNDTMTQESMVALEKEMSETLEYAVNKAKGLQKELEMSHLRKRMLEVELMKQVGER